MSTHTAKTTKQTVIQTALRHIATMQLTVAAVWGLFRWACLVNGWWSGDIGLWIPFALGALTMMLCNRETELFTSYQASRISAAVIVGSSILLFIGVNKFVEQQTAKRAHVPALTPTEAERLKATDILTVDTINPDTTVMGQCQSTYSQRNTIHYNLYEVYPLKTLPGIYVGLKATMAHHTDKYTTDEAYQQWQTDLWQLHANDLQQAVARQPLTMKRVKLQKDQHVYEMAAYSIQGTYLRPADAPPTIVYEIADKAALGRGWTSLCYGLLGLIIGDLILLCMYAARRFNDEEYTE